MCFLDPQVRISAVKDSMARNTVTLEQRTSMDPQGGVEPYQQAYKTWGTPVPFSVHATVTCHDSGAHQCKVSA